MGNEQNRDAPGMEMEKMTAGKRIDKQPEKEGKYLRFTSLRQAWSFVASCNMVINE